MPKPLKTLPVSAPDRKGVFGQGGKALRTGLYAWVSTHDQKTLPRHLSAMPGAYSPVWMPVSQPQAVI